MVAVSSNLCESYSPEVGEVMDRAQSSDSLVDEAVQQSSPNASVPPPRRLKMEREGCGGEANVENVVHGGGQRGSEYLR